ncbi:HAMP domain-containing histidine kinase [candidate division WOR-3 bacterium]|nr:HAMP domain-containing histidine kinase [candidate division WOR-3 bacterium]
MRDEILLSGSFKHISFLDILHIAEKIKPGVKLFLDTDSCIEFMDSKPVFAKTSSAEGFRSLKIILESSWNDFKLLETESTKAPNLVCKKDFASAYRAKLFPGETHIRLSEANKELSKDYLTMLEFYSRLIHELSNPLTIVKGNVQLLERHVSQNNSVPPEIKESVKQMEEKVSKQVSRMSKLIGSAKKLSKPTSRSERIYDIKTLLDEWVPSCEFMKNKDIQLYYSNEAREAKIFGEPDELIQAISNIIENAIQACLLSDKRPCVIVLYMTNSENCLIINVTDNGIGIDEENKNDVFQPFFSTFPEGFGLGLNVAKTIIDGMSGNIEIESKKGAGTEVMITLPLIK